MIGSRTPWLLREPSPPPTPLLLCFPYAGAGASSLRRWPDRIAGHEVHPVQLPGRENRIAEQPHLDIGTCAKDAVHALAPYLDRPYAVAGHCMGALLAHAFTLVVREWELRRPERLLVSASQVPYRGFHGFYHPWMSQRRIAAELRRVAGELGEGELPDGLLDVSIAVLRADVRMCLGHLPPVQPLNVPITAVGWSDDVDVDRDDLAEWRQYGATEEHVLPGEPLGFLVASPALCRVVEDALES